VRPDVFLPPHTLLTVANGGNQIDFTVRINREDVGELAVDLAKVEGAAKGVPLARRQARRWTA